MNIKLVPLQEHEKETFIRNIQIAFKKAVVEQFDAWKDEATAKRLDVEMGILDMDEYATWLKK